MDTPRRATFNFVPFAVTIAIIGVCFLVWMSLEREETFPALPVGAYIGRMSGLSEKKDDFVSIYVERIGSTNALLFVAFREGWKPQIVPLHYKPVRGEANASARTAAASRPIQVTNGELTMTLDGEEAQGTFTGEVVSSMGRRGVWTLRPIDMKDLRQDMRVVLEEFDFGAWLTQRAEQRRKTEERDSLEASIADKRDKVQKLTRYVSEERALKVRGRQRQTELETQLAEETEAQKGKLREVKDAVRDLEQLTRITPRGRAVELARRVGKRETKWYLVNWEKAQDLSSIEESLAREMGVDLSRLQESVKRADELNTLRETIQKERARIQKLQEMYQERRRIETSPAPDPVRPGGQPGGEEGPWWKRWDSLF